MSNKRRLPWLSILLIPSVGALLLWVYRFIVTGSWHYLFLNWNLVLAWLPVLFAYVLYQRQDKIWKIDAVSVLCLLGWVAFLPNSFYLLTDFIHLQTINNRFVMLDLVMMGLFAINGVVLGLSAVLLVHLTVMKRLEVRMQASILLILAFLIGFAIYLGRYLRWNSWDVLFNPAGILFDVSDRFINPASYPRTFSTTLLFAFLFLVLYIPIWLLARNYTLKQR